MTIFLESLINHYNSNVSSTPKIIFEIGAREANDSIRLKQSFPSATVYAFEAHPQCYNTHKDNVMSHDIQYYNLAMWSENKKLTFHDKGIESGISSFRDRGQQFGQATFELDAISPYDFCKQHKIKKIDILKLDVEGCTFEVLTGFGSLLPAIKMMHIETEREKHFKDQHLEKEVFSLLEKNDFRMLQHSWCCLKQYDSVWLKND